MVLSHDHVIQPSAQFASGSFSCVLDPQAVPSLTSTKKIYAEQCNTTTLELSIVKEFLAWSSFRISQLYLVVSQSKVVGGAESTMKREEDTLS